MNCEIDIVCYRGVDDERESGEEGNTKAVVRKGMGWERGEMMDI